MKKIAIWILTISIFTLGSLPIDGCASYALSMFNGTSVKLSSSSNYYFNSGGLAPAFIQTADASSLIAPASGTLTAIYGEIYTVYAASQEFCTVNILKNDIVVAQVTNSLALTNSGNNPFSNNGLNVAVEAGDDLQVQLVTPAWQKPPYGPSFSLSIYIQ